MNWVILWVMFGFIAERIYKRKGYSSGWGWFIGILLGPIGIIIALMEPTNRKEGEKLKKEGKQKITSEELGEGISYFCKIHSKTLYKYLSNKETLEALGLELDWELVLKLRKEITIIHFWIAAKILNANIDKERKALDILLKRISSVATPQELRERCKQYEEEWNEKSPVQQLALTLTMLNNMFGESENAFINYELQLHIHFAMETLTETLSEFK
ncbi:hypothetical protein KJ693_10890 [bacterium]|nr:hypothetical protein [bacterium]